LVLPFNKVFARPTAMAMSLRKQVSTVLIGNPGTGKSSTINCFTGNKLFKSDVSGSGSGITFELDKNIHDGNMYYDTPGLSDMKLRQAAAEAIDKVLQLGGCFKVLFVMTLEAGRLQMM